MIDIDNYIILVGIADDKYLLMNTTTPEYELKQPLGKSKVSFNSSSGVVAICS